MVDFSKSIQKQKNETNKEFISPVEEDTECDKCLYLQECINNGNVVNSTWWEDRKEHYIKGRGCICVASCESFLGLKLSEIRKMEIDEKMIDFIVKAIEQLGDMTYKEFYQNRRCFEMKFD